MHILYCYIMEIHLWSLEHFLCIFLGGLHNKGQAHKKMGQLVPGKIKSLQGKTPLQKQRKQKQQAIKMQFTYQIRCFFPLKI